MALIKELSETSRESNRQMTQASQIQQQKAAPAPAEDDGFSKVSSLIDKLGGKEKPDDYYSTTGSADINKARSQAMDSDAMAAQARARANIPNTY